ncbi:MULTISPECIES: uroporphyrinogen-III synthase [unclassified Sulfitobacter]|uniref:uroporphyrinogen-III synthase n=1 Tax=unclassified Sulfitobacter TaxID=196795 RepID=UPI0023E1755D|nr:MULTISPECIES: uroporphyrinogen-III synthase [unclassified Sulfitobacter]
MDRRALLLTRPRDSAERFLARLPTAPLKGVQLCISPLLEIEPTGEKPDLSQTKGVIFTSARAVALAPPGSGGDAYCVGAQTAAAARMAGWDVRLEAQTADALVAMMRDLRIEGKLLHLAGAHRRGQIAARLREAGTQVDVITLYDQRLRPLTDAAREMLAGEGPVIVPLFSPRTAEQFVNQTKAFSAVVVAAISPAVGAVLGGKSLKGLHIAKAPTGDEMARLVEMLLRNDRFP